MNEFRLSIIRISKLSYLSFNTRKISSNYRSAVSELLFTRKLNLLQRTVFLKRYFMDIATVVKIFEEMVPPHLAEPWDNTGLLIEPSKKKIVSTILFTNDLTENVLKEALSMKADMIISYHPPIFSPVKSLRSSNWKDNIVIQCIENSVAVYSPHTACDAVKDGVNDWLIKSFDLSQSWPIKQSYEPSSQYSHCLDVCLPLDTNVYDILETDSDVKAIQISSNEELQHLRIIANKDSLIKVFEKFMAAKAAISASLLVCSPLPLPSCGMGRIGKLKVPLKICDCIAVIKDYLKLSHVRFSQGITHTLDTEVSVIAVCAGSGASLLKGVPADLYITGEMSHHDLLDAIHKKVSVILCEHSNSERGYLLELIRNLQPRLYGIGLIVSTLDKDPITIV